MVSKLNKIKNIKIVDTTFREGRQSKLSEKLSREKFPAYLKTTTKLGIHSYELSGDLIDKDLLKIIRKYPQNEFYFHGYPSTRNWNYFLDKRVKNISSFVDLQKAKGRILTDLIEHSSNFESVRLSIENAFDLPKKNLLLIIRKILKITSLKRIGFSDTSGVCTPDMIEKFFVEVIPQIPNTLGIEFHFHNDQGLAAANFYELCKRSYLIKNNIVVSTSIGGLGERNGILSLGDVFAILSHFRHKDLSLEYNLKQYASVYKIIFNDNTAPQRDPLSPGGFFHHAKSHVEKIKEGVKFSALDPKNFGFCNKY